MFVFTWNSLSSSLLTGVGGKDASAHSDAPLPRLPDKGQNSQGQKCFALADRAFLTDFPAFPVSLLSRRSYTRSSTNNAPFLLHNLLLQNHKQVILYCDNMTLKHTIWRFRWNVQIITITSYAHIIILPTTLKQALFLRDPLSPPFNSRPSGVPFKLLSLTSRSAALPYHRELDITITTEGQAHVLHSWASHYWWHMPRTLSPMHLGSFLINVGYTFHSICDNFKNYEEWLGWNVYNMT